MASDENSEEDFSSAEENRMKPRASPAPSLASSINGRSRGRGRIPRFQHCEGRAHSPQPETGDEPARGRPSSSISRRKEFPAFKSPLGLRGRRGAAAAGAKHARDYRNLVKAAQRDVVSDILLICPLVVVTFYFASFLHVQQAAARRFAATHRRRGAGTRGRGGGGGGIVGRPRGSISRQLNNPRQQTRRQNDDEVADGVEEGEEEEAVCVAPGGCKHPSGNVNWVACDQCNAWYHQRCVGIMNSRDVSCHGDIGELRHLRSLVIANRKSPIRKNIGTASIYFVLVLDRVPIRFRSS